MIFSPCGAANIRKETRTGAVIVFPQSVAKQSCVLERFDKFGPPGNYFVSRFVIIMNGNTLPAISYACANYFIVKNLTLTEIISTA